MDGPYYSRQQLERILRLKPRQLERWQRRGLFPRLPRYTWMDLLRARVLCRYAAAAIRPGKLAASLEALRAHVPGLEDPWKDATLGIAGGRVEVHFDGQTMDALSGQLRLPFEPPPGRQLKPAPTPAARRRQEAEQWFAMALSLESEKELREQAAEAYLQCLKLDPGFCSAYVNLGTLRYNEKDFGSAEQCYRRALALDPSYALAHFNLGNVLDETGRLDDAVEAYLQAVRLAPGYADAHYNLALAYQRQGQHRRAIPHWRRYLGLDRESLWANHARSQLKQTLRADKLQLVGGAETRAAAAAASARVASAGGAGEARGPSARPPES
ncbi:MAG: tetratricopeptide repeat protein [Terriglobales bacterium]